MTDNGEMPATYDDNARMATAWHLVSDTNANVFLTGKAGTGKTTFLRRLRERSPKRMVVLAPTGIAAVNAGGVTIHSFFQLPVGQSRGEGGSRYDRFSKDKLRLIRSLDLVVIDEISMVRADLLDAVDRSLRRHRCSSRPFGGVQMLLIGDLCQLAPVTRPEEWELLSREYDTPYFFSSHALSSTPYEVVNLETTYRQKDDRFLKILNSIRTNTAGRDVLDALNSRVRHGWDPTPSEGYIRLVTHNEQARLVNESRLAVLPGVPTPFSATVRGEFPDGGCPAESELLLKPGAQVMFLRNDASNGVYNGMIGTVNAVGAQTVSVRPVGEDRVVDVGRVEWQNVRYALDEASGAIREEVTGSFRQFPLRLAWAITVHKSQGLTFDRAIIDLTRSFAHGQSYVALSRCRTLEGVVLENPLTRGAIIFDHTVADFIAECEARSVTPEHLRGLENEGYADTLTRLFDFSEAVAAFDAVRRVVVEYFMTARPVLVSEYDEKYNLLEHSMVPVAKRFLGGHIPVMKAVLQTQADGVGPVILPEAVNTRIADAACYFSTELEPVIKLLRDTPVKTDNKVVTKRLTLHVTEALDIFNEISAVLKAFAGGDLSFSPEEYYRQKDKAFGVALADNPGKRRKTVSPTPSVKKPSLNAQTSQPADTAETDPGLVNALKAWRLRRACEGQVPAFVIASDKALTALAEARPSTFSELEQVKYWGAVKAARYADDLLDIIARYL